MPPISRVQKQCNPRLDVWLSFAIQWPNRDLYLFVFFPKIGKHARLVTCWRRWRSKVRNPMFLGRCKGTSPQTPWFIGSRVFDTLCGRSGICDPGSQVQFFKSRKMLESLWKVCALIPIIIEVKPIACLWDVFCLPIFWKQSPIHPRSFAATLP